MSMNDVKRVCWGCQTSTVQLGGTTLRLGMWICAKCAQERKAKAAAKEAQK